MQNRFRELDIFSFSLSEGFIPITDSGAKYFELIRDNHKKFFGDETLNLQLGGAGK